MKSLKALFLFGSLSASAAITAPSAFASTQTSGSDEPCEVLRAAFDIGSGSTKMRLYRYDGCRRRIAARVDGCEAEAAVAYREDLSDSGTLREETILRGIKVLRRLKAAAEACGSRQFAGVATSAFRIASNGPSALERLSQATGIPLALITPDEEARLGFEGALAASDTDQDDACVWDIGTSSMQMTCSGENGHSDTYKGRLASVAFKEAVMDRQRPPRLLQPFIKVGIFLAKGFGYTHEERSSPNPISFSDYDKAMESARIEAEKIQRFFGHSMAGKRLFGIGGVHYHSVRTAVDATTYTSEDIHSALLTRLEKTDEELGGGNFVSTAVSNLILVEGIMDALDIDSVEAIDTGLTEGLAACDEYWE